MPGFRHSPLDDIQRIRQDLRDRYQDGFPILKELLQNSDDAGADQPGDEAKQLVLMLGTNGLPGAKHPLLQAAGLAVLNDGVFSASDAVSITSLGMSNKAGQSGAAGKFGLGLKSIFHWAEAFFYFSPHSFGNQVDPPVESCDFLNPWWSRESRSGRHKNWENDWQESREAAVRAFEQLVIQVVRGNRWFGLWIPLRQSVHLEDGNGRIEPIEQNFPEPHLDSLLGREWKTRLLETIPLLRRLQTVQVCEWDGEHIDERGRFEVAERTQRMRFGLNNPSGAATYQQMFSGSIQSSNISGLSCQFSGIERLDDPPSLHNLKNHPQWPNQTAIDENGRDRQVPEKAEPHGAVVFTRQFAGGTGSLRIQNAVFLPLDEPEKLPCEGQHRYCLYLHGIFFVDSGRRGIRPFDDLQENVSVAQDDSELRIIKLWNRDLQWKVVAPLILPTLSAFVKQEQMTAEEIESLVDAILKAKSLRPLRSKMCLGQRFLYRLQPGGGAWTHETWEINNGLPPRLLVLPKPDFSENELVELLPELEKLSGKATVCLRGKSDLVEEKPEELSDNELADLLESVLIIRFEEKAYLKYLLDLIPSNVAKSGNYPALVKVLVRLAKKLLGQELPKEKPLEELWIEFFNRLPESAFISLPFKSGTVAPEIQQSFVIHDLPVALLWEDWRPEKGKGELYWKDLVPMLQSLAALELAEEDKTKQRSAIAVRLLEECREKPSPWPESVSALRLFSWRKNCEQTGVTSWADLKHADDDGRLFTRGAPWVRDLKKAAPEAKPVMVDVEVARVLGISEKACDPGASVRLLKTARCLDSDFSNRKPLFDRLLKEGKGEGLSNCQAMRCLLHGELSEWESGVGLICEPKVADVFVKLARLALAAGRQPWRRIPYPIASQLGLDEEQKRNLNVRGVSAEAAECLVKEIGPESMDCACLKPEECEKILTHFNDIGVLRGLNIHEAGNGGRVQVMGNTYVDDGMFTELPEAFNQLVTRIRARIGYERFRNEDGSNRLVNRLSWEAVIEIALKEPAPAKWWGIILAAIGKLGSLRSELRKRVEDVAWLELAAGGSARPADVLHFAGAEGELDRLPPELLKGRVPILRLAASFQKHERFDTFSRTVLAGAMESSATLATLLKEHPAWSTGLTDQWSAEQVADWVAGLGDAPEGALPVANLIKAIHSEEKHREMLLGFMGKISGKLGETAYGEVLKHLAAKYKQADQEQRAVYNRVFLRYLSAVDAEGASFCRKVLERNGVTLLSASGKWKPAGELAFPKEGLSEDCVVTKPIAQAMAKLKVPFSANITENEEEEKFEEKEDADASEEEVWKFFAPWRKFLPTQEPIGVLLRVLRYSETQKDWAERTFSTFDPEIIERWFEQNHKGLLEKLRDAQSSPPLRIIIRTGNTVIVDSLLGRPFEASLSKKNKRLILEGDPSWDNTPLRVTLSNTEPGAGSREIQAKLQERTRKTLRFLPLDPLQVRMSVPDAVRCIQDAAEQVINNCTGDHIDLTSLFEGLCETAQVEVQVAQSLVVEAALGLLRQIGGHGHPPIKEALDLWDRARVAEAEAESLKIIELRKKAEDQRREAMNAIRTLLKDDIVAQSAVLDEVRSKLKGNYSYDSESVLFEIWQNADDAVCELERLGGPPKKEEVALFNVFSKPGQLMVLHFGRLINQYRLPGGRSQEELGFKRDLEKMVVQSISDKPLAGLQGSSPLTGKFGLGFKSVFLLCDAPEVVSGNLDFVIRGGIFPVRLKEDRREALIAELKKLAPGQWRRGTIFCFPTRRGCGPELGEMLKRFHRLGPVLVAFSRKLKRLRLHQIEDRRFEVSWRPEKLSVGIEVGQVSELKGDVSHFLVLSRKAGNDRIQILLGLDEHGFVPLPKDVPMFWITAPTRDTPDYGFAVNGPFEPDVGRTQLKLNSTHNENLANEFGNLVVEGLKSVWKKALENWEALGKKLGLAKSVTLSEFGESLWELLGRRFAEKCSKSENSLAGNLARRILWNSEISGLGRFYSEFRGLPSGLWGEYQVLSRLGEIKYVTAGALDRKEVFRVVRQWEGFQTNFRPGRIISERRVAAVLKGFKVKTGSLISLFLAQVVKEELLQKQFRAFPGLDGLPGQLFIPPNRTLESLLPVPPAHPTFPSGRPLLCPNSSGGNRWGSPDACLQNGKLLASPATAKKLGQLVTAEFLKTLKEKQTSQGDENDYKELFELLPQIHFKAADCGWQVSADLVVSYGEGLDPDEKMRAAFAPPRYRLDSEYTGPALLFFRACRTRLQADVETLFEWILEAKDNQSQSAAVQYLLNGDEGMRHRLAKKAREAIQAGRGGWLEDLEELPWLKSTCGWEERKELDVHILRTRKPEGMGCAPPALRRDDWTAADLLAWWRSEARQEREYTLDGANWPLLLPESQNLEENNRAETLRCMLREPDSDEGRKTWYRLFGLGCLMSEGRRTTELRDFWTRELEGEGKFWSATSLSLFRDGADEVFNRLCERRFAHVHAKNERAYYWRRLFYDVRKMHRLLWESEFASVILERAKTVSCGRELIEFIRSGHLPGQEAWFGVLGQSVGSPLFFIIRELRRLGAIENPAVDSAAFFPCRPVRRAAASIGWIEQRDVDVWAIEDLLRVAEALHGKVQSLAELSRDYDIPLLHMGLTCQALPPAMPNQVP